MQHLVVVAGHPFLCDNINMSEESRYDDRSLYDRVGGTKVIQKIVDEFYDNILADGRVNYFFDGYNVNALRKHQVDFLTYAFGGKSEYNGRTLHEAHGKLIENHGLEERHFDAVIDNLMWALESQKLPRIVTAEILAVARSTKSDIFGQ